MIKLILTLLLLPFLCFAQGGMMPGPGVKGYAAAPSYVLKDEITDVSGGSYVGWDTTADRYCLRASYDPSSSFTLRKLELQLYKVGSPTQTLTVSICDDDATNCVAADATLDASTLAASPGNWEAFTFATGKALSGPPAWYSIVIEASAVSDTNYVAWRRDTVADTAMWYNSSSGCSGSWVYITTYQAVLKAYAYE